MQSLGRSGEASLWRIVTEFQRDWTGASFNTALMQKVGLDARTNVDRKLK
jgi:hypothetical protein